MKFVQTAKALAIKHTVNHILSILSVASDDNMLRLLGLGQKLTPNKGIKDYIAKMRERLEQPNHPGRLLFKRVQTYLPKENLARLFQCLITNTFLLGSAKRDEFEEKWGFRPPFLIIISPTMKCNLKCVGCYSRDYVMERGLSFEEIDSIIKQAKDIGIYFITFLGGEPFVRKDLFDIYEKHHDVYFQVYTNGTLMTKENARRLRELGNVAVVLSLEGFEKETDERRGKGVYRALMRSMDMLREERVLYGSSSTASRDNIDTIISDEFIDMLVDKGVLAHHYYLYMPVSADADTSYMPTVEQRSKIRQRVAEMRGAKPIWIIDFWNDGPFVGGCIAGGRRYIHINSRGDVEPCVYTHFATDSVRGKSLAECLNSPFFHMIREHQPHSDNLLTPCMIIDNPHIMRKIVAQCCAKATHEGAENVITKAADELDEYARKLHELLDPVWDEYMRRNNFNVDEYVQVGRIRKRLMGAKAAAH